LSIFPSQRGPTSVCLSPTGRGLTASVPMIRGGLVFKAHRWLYHSTLGSRVIKKKKGRGLTASVSMIVLSYSFRDATCFRGSGLGGRLFFFFTLVTGSRRSLSLQGVRLRGRNLEAGSYLRLTDSCITQLEAQGPSRTCNESKEEATCFRVSGLGGRDLGLGSGMRDQC